MADEKVTITLDIEGNVEPTIANLKALQKQLKQTAAGTEEFTKTFNQIDDLKDKLKGANKASSDWIDTLEGAGGPLGMLGKGLNSVKVATQSFGGALKATGIGLIVSLIGGLVAAFSKTEGSLKKLDPLLIGLEKIFGGIVEVMQPLLDIFLELALKALPYITSGIGKVYSGFVAFFTLIKEAGSGVGKVLKGIFTLDTDAISAGYDQIKGSLGKTVEAYNAGVERFEAGTKKLTKTEKENLKERQADADKALQDKIKRLEAEGKLDEAKLAKDKAIAMQTAFSEEQKLAVEEKFAKLEYDLKSKQIEDKLKLYAKDSDEYKALLAEQTKNDADYIQEKTDFNQKSIELAAERAKEIIDFETKLAEDLRKLDEKAAADARGILAVRLQSRIEALDAENARIEGDFAQDLERLAEKRELLNQQEQNDLANTELTEFQKTEIRKKYADARKQVSDQEIATEKAAAEAKQAINMAYLQLFEQFGNVLGQVAGKNKALAIAGIVISQAASIGQIIANTGIANAKAVAASPLTFGAPWVAINTISAGLSIASTIASAVKSIQQINQAAGAAGVTGGGSGGSVSSAPQLAPPRVGAPQMSATQSQSGQIAGVVAGALDRNNSQGRPIRAYVVGSEITSEQQLQRRLRTAARLGG